MIDVMRREIARALAGVRSALRAIQSSLTLSTRTQRVSGEGLSGEALNDMELFQHFGFSSAPPKGTQLIVLPIGGRTSAAIVVATEHGAYRFHLTAEGEAAIYNQWGDVVHLRQDRKIHLKAAAEVTVEAPLATFSGDVQVAGTVTVGVDVQVAGTVTAAVDVIAAGVPLATHVHGGVQAGSATTGAPS